MNEKDDASQFIDAILEGIRAAEEGRVLPAREALPELGRDLGIPIEQLADEALKEFEAGQTRSLEDFLEL